MKTLIYLFATAMFLFAGCAKDGIFTENAVNPELKKAEVPVPFRVELCGTPDMESEFKLLPIPGIDPGDPNNYYATRMFLSGIVTHLGNVDSENSYTEIENMVFIIENGSPFLQQTGGGKMVAANGDYYEFTNWVKMALPSLSYTCGSEIIPGSGTGRFKGISGSTTGIGQVDRVNHTNCWTAEGRMEYK
jgi:hypothetical protein